MDKRFFEKRCHFSIRKFAIGAASVMIGASVFGLQVAQAAETESSVSADAPVHQVEPKDKLSEEPSIKLLLNARSICWAS